MAVASTVTARLEKIDREIISLLEQRVGLAQALCEEDPEGFSLFASDTVGFWDEEAEDRGLEPAGLARICREVDSLCRRMAKE